MSKVRSDKRFDKEHRKRMSESRKHGYIDKIEDGKKLCPKCEQMLDLSFFHKARKRTNGYQLWCKECNKEAKSDAYHAYRRDKTLEQARKSALKKKYRLTPEEYQEKLISQGQVCAICGNKEKQKSNPNGKTDRLRVDHCHKTGKIRGLLCCKCNFGISHFDEDPFALSNAIDYIIKYYKEHKQEEE